MSDLRKVINVLSVGHTKDAAAKTLEGSLSGATCDNNVWTVVRDGFTFKGYIKCPGLDHFEEIDSFTDVILVTCPASDKAFNEISNYVLSRNDCSNILLVDSEDRSKCADLMKAKSCSSEDVAMAYKDAIESATKINEVWGKHCGDSHTTTEEDLCTKVFQDLEADDYDCIPNRIEVEEVDKRYFSYNSVRLYVNSTKFNGERHRDFMKATKLEKKLRKALRYVKGSMDTFIKKQTTLSGSENHGRFEIKSGDETNGVSVDFTALVGEAYDKKFGLEPLLVRDNPLTVSLELALKSDEDSQSAYDGLKSIYQFAEMMGLLKEPKHLGFEFEIRKGDSKNVFVDVTMAPITSSGLVADLRSLKLNQLNISIEDTFKFATNVSVGDVVNDFSLKNIIDKATCLQILGKGDIFNIKNLLRVLRDGIANIKKESKQKNMVLVTSGLMMLTTFENLNFNLELSNESIKSVVQEVLENMGEEEGGFEGYCTKIDGMVSQGMLPMALQTLESVKPMLEPYMGLIGSLNFDNIYLNVQSPVLRAIVRLGLNLPGTTDFVAKNLL